MEIGNEVTGEEVGSVVSSGSSVGGNMVNLSIGPGVVRVGGAGSIGLDDFVRDGTFTG